MPLSPEAAVKLAVDLIAQHDRELDPLNGSVGKIARYLEGNHDLPYMPRGARAEYVALAQKSITNWLPLISDVFAKNLFVDGYRAAKAPDNVKSWAFWQANGLDARQTIAHRGALEYGTSYVLVWAAEPAPLIRPLTAKRVFALFADPDDEWPLYGIVRGGKTVTGDVLVDLYDGAARYAIVIPTDRSTDPYCAEIVEHSLGVTPLVRFRDRLDGDARGIIAPLVTVQDRINEAVFALLIALQYASFRQRWATGLVIPVDEEETLPDGTPNPSFGRPIEPFEAAVDRLWVTDSPEAKFGDFAQTETSGHLAAYEAAVKTLAAIAQTPPHVLLGDLINLSADALAAAESQTQRKASEYETIFGEAWEQVFRLAALAAGDAGSALDTAAQVRWRDTEARALAATVDALGKMVQMLGVPAEATWERIPGVTQTDVEAWKTAAAKVDGLGAFADRLLSQAQSAAQNPQTPASDPNAGGGVSG